MGKYTSVLSLSVTVAILAFVFACSNNDNIVPVGSTKFVSNNINVFATVVPGSTADNILLLQDGRLANAISGIPDLNKMKIDSRLLLTFNSGSTHRGIVDINVQKYSSAQNSSSLVQSNSIPSFAGGTFSGTVTRTNITDSTNNFSGPVTIYFANSNSYVCTGGPIYPLNGSGTYAITNTNITFRDSFNTKGQYLNGAFNYYYDTSSGYLYLNTYRNGIYYSFVLEGNLI